MSNLADLQYPIGKFSRVESLSPADRTAAINTLATLPAQLAAALDGLTDAQLDTPYRPGGWTIRQLVHHIADSHMNAYSRMRLALTAPASGEWPTIYAYNQSAWVELPDVAHSPVTVPLQIVDGVHQRLVAMLRTVPEAAWQGRGVLHPENGRQSLEQVLPLYAWHSKHHLAHIVNCRVRSGW